MTEPPPFGFRGLEAAEAEAVQFRFASRRPHECGLSREPGGLWERPAERRVELPLSSVGPAPSAYSRQRASSSRLVAAQACSHSRANVSNARQPFED